MKFAQNLEHAKNIPKTFFWIQIIYFSTNVRGATSPIVLYMYNFVFKYFIYLFYISADQSSG